MNYLLVHLILTLSHNLIPSHSLIPSHRSIKKRIKVIITQPLTTDKMNNLTYDHDLNMNLLEIIEEQAFSINVNIYTTADQHQQKTPLSHPTHKSQTKSPTMNCFN